MKKTSSCHDLQAMIQGSEWPCILICTSTFQTHALAQPRYCMGMLMGAIGRTYLPSIPVLTVAVVCENLKYTSYVVCTNTLHMWSLILWPFKLFKYCSYRAIILSSNLSIFQNVLKMMKSSFLDSLAVKSLNSIENWLKFIKKLEFRPLSGLQGCNSAAGMVHSMASPSRAPSRRPRCSLSDHLKCLNSNFFIPLNQFSISSCLLTAVHKEKKTIC